MASVQPLKQPVFSSKMLMDEIQYDDFYTVTYIGLLRLFLIVVAVVYVLSFSLVIMDNSYSKSCGLAFFCALVLWIIYTRIQKRKKANYQQLLIKSNGMPAVYTSDFYNDIIVVTSSGSEEKRYYDYSIIKDIFESPCNYLLFIKPNLYIVVNKANLKSETKEEFLSFIFQKVKKVRALKTKNKKALCSLACGMVSFLFICLAVLAFLNSQFSSVERLVTTDYGDNISLYIERCEDIHHTYFNYTVKSYDSEGYYHFVTTDPNYRITDTQIDSVAMHEDTKIYSVDCEYIYISNGYLGGFNRNISIEYYLTLNLPADKRQRLLDVMNMLIVLNDPQIDTSEFVKIVQYEKQKSISGLCL